jgi:hypothetical protein
VYVQQPEGFHVGNPGTVCRLHKALYGLKQAPRAWHESLTSVLVDAGYKKSSADASLYFKEVSGDVVYVLSIRRRHLVGGCFTDLWMQPRRSASHFTVKDMGEVRYFLGMQVTMVRDDAGVLISVKLTTRNSITELLKVFRYADYKPKAIPLGCIWRLAPDEGEPLAEGNRYRELLGKVLYLASLCDLNSSCCGACL